MGRRSAAPQPLALNDEPSFTAVTDCREPPSSTAATLSSPDSTALGASDSRSPRSARSPAFANDHTLQVISPVTSNKSERSPRSPFSKFNAARRPQTQQGEPRQVPLETHEKLPLRSADDTQVAHQKTQYSNQAVRHPPPAPFLKQSATSPALPQPSNGRGDEEKHSRSGSRFLFFGKGSKQLQHNHDRSASSSEAMTRGADAPPVGESVVHMGSKQPEQSSPGASTGEPAPLLPTSSDVSLSSTAENDASKKNKPNAFMGRRNKLTKNDQSPREAMTIKMPEPDRLHTSNGPAPLKTAPIHADARERSFRHKMDSSLRNQSADRAVRDPVSNKEYRSDKENRSHPSSIKDGGGSNFFSGLKSSGRQAADMISKGIFGKGGRGASTNERDPAVDDEHYVLKVLSLPLDEQTRKTRISKRLEESRDKTEFWMPAFPWRAIDYLNFNGIDSEGLYRVPGSGPQIKRWQRRFDEELDIDLFVQDDLYDINIIGSMLKAWLRELPDELFPKEAQEEISRSCTGAEETPPPLLVKRLSQLPPYKYYLLFAITCHLSLLLAHSDKNKMDFRNLCICFQPCMKIDAFCFKFLVCDWRLCWQGCKNEGLYIRQEYELFQQPLPRGLNPDYDDSREERVASSSGGSKERAYHQEQHEDGARDKILVAKRSNSNLQPQYSTPPNIAVLPDRDRPERPERSDETPPPLPQRTQLPPLSPIKPLSPLGF
ncbi:hypothetical protein F5Y18DRAFT_90654 [Xylariaceae sp. FL1019]|nr:hypothetical protein F5Y18DRAFT_90654 [Xylariaceae sp. FL1019]